MLPLLLLRLVWILNNAHGTVAAQDALHRTQIKILIL